MCNKCSFTCGYFGLLDPLWSLVGSWSVVQAAQPPHQQVQWGAMDTRTGEVRTPCPAATKSPQVPRDKHSLCAYWDLVLGINGSFYVALGIGGLALPPTACRTIRRGRSRGLDCRLDFGSPLVYIGRCSADTATNHPINGPPVRVSEKRARAWALNPEIASSSSSSS